MGPYDLYEAQYRAHVDPPGDPTLEEEERDDKRVRDWLWDRENENPARDGNP